MIAGIVLGAAAGALWALTFVAPTAVEPWGPFEITAVRFASFGLAAVAGLVVLRFNPFRRLDRAGWLRVCALGLLGNVLYYLLAGQAIQMTGPTPVALVLGTLPVGLAVIANLRRRSVPWGRLLPPLCVISVGIVVVTLGAADADAGSTSTAAAGVGMALAVVALLSWLAYAVLNAEWLTGSGRRAGIAPLEWTCLTGLGTLIVLIPVLAVAIAVRPDLLNPAPGASTAELIAWGLAIGLASTWVATWLWNGASARLPTALLGYLIVSETLFAMAYDCIMAARAPTPAELGSAALILGGVVWGLTAAGARRRPPAGDPVPDAGG